MNFMSPQSKLKHGENGEIILCQKNVKSNLFTHVTRKSLELVIKCTCMISNYNLLINADLNTFPNTVTVLIFVVFRRRIINKFKKVILYFTF